MIETQSQPQPDVNQTSIFFNFVRDTNLLSNTTKLIYLNRLSIIQNEIDNTTSLLWKILHPEEFAASLIEFGKQSRGRISKNLSPASLTQYITIMISLITHFQNIQENNPDLIKRWKKVKREISEPTEEHYLSNEPNAKQKNALYTFEELVNIRDKLRSGTYSKLLFCLYTMIPPVRSNYDNMKILHNMPNKKELLNYMVLGNENVIILNIYKTSKLYDTITIEMPNELVKEVKKSLKRNPREYLFVNKQGNPYTKANTWNAWANRLLKQVLHNEDFTLTMFRHIYLSRKDLELSKKNRGERKKIADLMGHSLDTQDKYIFKD